MDILHEIYINGYSQRVDTLVSSYPQTKLFSWKKRPETYHEYQKAHRIQGTAPNVYLEDLMALIDDLSINEPILLISNSYIGGWISKVLAYYARNNIILIHSDYDSEIPEWNDVDSISDYMANIEPQWKNWYHDKLLKIIKSIE